MPKDESEIGALWIKSGRRGEYMTGKIGDVAVVLFRNEKKASPRQPDWRVLKVKPKDQADQRRQDDGDDF